MKIKIQIRRLKYIKNQRNKIILPISTGRQGNCVKKICIIHFFFHCMKENSLTCEYASTCTIR